MGRAKVDHTLPSAAERERIPSIHLKTARVLIAVIAVIACISIEFMLARSVLESGFLPNAWCIGS